MMIQMVEWATGSEEESGKQGLEATGGSTRGGHSLVIDIRKDSLGPNEPPEPLIRPLIIHGPELLAREGVLGIEHLSGAAAAVQDPFIDPPGVDRAPAVLHSTIHSNVHKHIFCTWRG